MAVRDSIVENLNWKLAALAMAVFTWFSIQFAIWKGLGGTRSMTIPAQPVRVLLAPDDPSTYRVEPPAVSVALRTPASGQAAIEQGRLQAFVSVVDAPETPVETLEVFVRGPREVEVLRIEPRYVHVHRLARSTNSPTKLKSTP